MKVCPRCGMSDDSDASFCVKCGRKLLTVEKVCEHCGHQESNPKLTYCISCGKPLTIEASKSDSPKHVPKRTGGLLGLISSNKSAFIGGAIGCLSILTIPIVFVLLPFITELGVKPIIPTVDTPLVSIQPVTEDPTAGIQPVDGNHPPNIQIEAMDISGIVTFKDPSTEEDIIVAVVDVNGTAMQNMTAVYEHGARYPYEAFFVLNGQNEVAAANFYSHNSYHEIVVEPNVMHRANPDQERAIAGYLSEMGNRNKDFYRDTLTCEEMEGVNNRFTSLIRFLVDVIGMFFGVDNPTGELKIDDTAPCTGKWDWYESISPAYGKPEFVFIKSQPPDIESVEVKEIEDGVINVAWLATDPSEYSGYRGYKIDLLDHTVFLGPTAFSDITYHYRLLNQDGSTHTDWTETNLTQIMIEGLIDEIYTLEVFATDEVINSSETRALIVTPSPDVSFEVDDISPQVGKEFTIMVTQAKVGMPYYQVTANGTRIVSQATYEGEVRLGDSHPAFEIISVESSIHRLAITLKALEQGSYDFSFGATGEVRTASGEWTNSGAFLGQVTIQVTSTPSHLPEPQPTVTLIPSQPPEPSPFPTSCSLTRIDIEGIVKYVDATGFEVWIDITMIHPNENEDGYMLHTNSEGFWPFFYLDGVFDSEVGSKVRIVGFLQGHFINGNTGEDIRGLTLEYEGCKGGYIGLILSPN